jgi:hypothetical protein
VRDVSEEHLASIFKVEEYVKQETKVKAAPLAICVHVGFSFMAYSSAAKMTATCFSETSVDFQRTIRRYFQVDRTFSNVTV